MNVAWFCNLSIYSLKETTPRSHHAFTDSSDIFFPKFCFNIIIVIYICCLCHITMCRICLRLERDFPALVLYMGSIENHWPILVEFPLTVCRLDTYRSYCWLSKMVWKTRVFQELTPFWSEKSGLVFRLPTISLFVVGVSRQMLLFASFLFHCNHSLYSAFF